MQHERREKQGGRAWETHLDIMLRNLTLSLIQTPSPTPSDTLLCPCGWLQTLGARERMYHFPFELAQDPMPASVPASACLTMWGSQGPP